MNEYFQTIGFLPQNIIGTAPHDDAGSLLGNLQNDLVLDIPQNIFIGRPQRSVGKQRLQMAAGHTLARLLYIVLGKTAFFGQLLDQFGIIAGDAELLRDGFSNGAAAAAKFTADGNNAVFDTASTPSVLSFR